MSVTIGTWQFHWHATHQSANHKYDLLLKCHRKQRMLFHSVQLGMPTHIWITVNAGDTACVSNEVHLNSIDIQSQQLGWTEQKSILKFCLLWWYLIPSTFAEFTSCISCVPQLQGFCEKQHRTVIMFSVQMNSPVYRQNLMYFCNNIYYVLTIFIGCHHKHCSSVSEKARTKMFCLQRFAAIYMLYTLVVQLLHSSEPML